ncbi:MAG: maleylpyruvate isomerase N-terminal domain-containing protein, partial [Nocardioides sp.]
MAETALEVGADAPTLCDGWDTKDLVCHLLVRESSPLGAPGIAVPALSGLTDREMSRLRKRPFDDLVARLRDRRLTFFA